MADTKLTALSAITALSADDLLYAVDDPGGTPASKKITSLDAFGFLASLGAISVTGAVTATIGRWHYCTGTSADYTVTLPTAVGNGGKSLGLIMGPASALSKLVTIDGDGTEKIDDALTRVMWSLEVSLLYSDNANWFKVGGKSFSMRATMYLTADQNVNNNTVTKINLDGVNVDNTGRMADVTNFRINIIRAGSYRQMGQVVLESVTAGRAITVLEAKFGAGAMAQVGLAECPAAATFPSPLAQTMLSYGAADQMELYSYQNSGGAINANGGGLTQGVCAMNAQENDPW